MDVPFDVVDHIFSFLKSHPKALIACSKAHPVLCKIAERHRFQHIIIRTGATDFTYSFIPSHLLVHLTETPHIVKYVAVVQIEFKYYPSAQTRIPYLEQIASLLPMFPVLECIMLSTKTAAVPWPESLPPSFRIAVKNCLRLPTLQEVHIGNMSFPLSILDNHANIKHLSLSGPPKVEPEYRQATYPLIKSLTLEEFGLNDSTAFRSWAKRHIIGLQSLKYHSSSHERILKIVEFCSDTLENLYLCLRKETPLSQVFGQIDLSSLPHLQRLTIHTEIDFWTWGGAITSRLSRAVDIIKTASSLQQLTVEIYIDPCLAILDRVDLSPLTVLSKSFVRFPHIDLYIYTGSPRLRITRTVMDSLLARHEGLVELMKRGVLVVHPEKTAPTLL